MTKRRIAVGLVSLLLAGGAAAQGPELSKLEKPQPTVPQIFTLQGQYVRIAYNNEGFATMGYRAVQQEIGNEWLLLTVGLTVVGDTPNEKIKRDAFSVRTPDGKTLPLATQTEYANASGALRALNARTKMIRDSINYFPVGAQHACPIQFFADLDKRGLAYDEVELATNRGCVGRLYFHQSGGIQTGQYWLDVKFAGSVVQVPFRVFTKEQAKEFEKEWEDIKEKHEEGYKKK
jgi:hypothetical protein